jgi:hypothetical protein
MHVVCLSVATACGRLRRPLRGWRVTDSQAQAPSDAFRTAGEGGTASTVKVFVSYRRDDVPDATDRLVDSLVKRFGRRGVFLDIDQIEIGAPFAEVIQAWVARCDVLLAVIGRRWLDAQDADDGTRRLDSPADFVRLEIEAALLRNIRVVPVMIHGTPIPKEDALPASMAPLAARNAIELSRLHWDADVDRLVAAIERIAADGGATSRPGERLHSEPSPDHLAHTNARPRPDGTGATPGPAYGSPAVRRSAWRMPALAAMAAVVGAVGAVLAFKGSGSASQQRSNPPVRVSTSTVTATQPTATSSTSVLSPPSSTGRGPSATTSTAPLAPQHSSAVATTSRVTSSAAGPLQVVSRYWEDVHAHRFSTAYADLAPTAKIESESQFVTSERAQGLEQSRFIGRTASLNGSTGRVDVVSLMTRDRLNGCREWEGWYAMTAATGRWLIAKASIESHKCNS